MWPLLRLTSAWLVNSNYPHSSVFAEIAATLSLTLTMQLTVGKLRLSVRESVCHSFVCGETGIDLVLLGRVGALLSRCLNLKSVQYLITYVTHNVYFSNVVTCYICIKQLNSPLFSLT